MNQSNDNHQFKALADGGTSQTRLENPFFVDYKKSGLNKLFLQGGHDSASSRYVVEDFNTDTRIGMLGGLSLWQFTAIIIFSLLFIGFAGFNLIILAYRE